MRDSRQTSAVLLLATLIVGSLVAPVSHYLFMALSDAYAPIQGSTHHGSSHGATLTPDDSGAAIHTAEIHLICRYADLFATFVATTGATADSVTATPLLRSYLLKIDQPARSLSFNVSLSRAPPLA